jgi:hypothetical protein
MFDDALLASQFAKRIAHGFKKFAYFRLLLTYGLLATNSRFRLLNRTNHPQKPRRSSNPNRFIANSFGSAMLVDTGWPVATSVLLLNETCPDYATP